jgi:hypothetical protein
MKRKKGEDKHHHVCGCSVTPHAANKTREPRTRGNTRVWYQMQVWQCTFDGSIQLSEVRSIEAF